MPIGPLQTVEIPDMQITLSDGAAQNPVPATLEFLPYCKRDGTCARDALTHQNHHLNVVGHHTLSPKGPYQSL